MAKKCRGRPKLGKEQVSIDLYPATLELARTRAERDGIPFCEAIDRSIQEACSPITEAKEKARLHRWEGLMSVPCREMTKVEASSFNELYTMAVTRSPLPQEVSQDRSIQILRERLTEAQSVKGLVMPIADDYVITLCGLISDRPGIPGLWAYTLYLLYKQKGFRTVTMDDWVRVFPEGVPAETSLNQALLEQVWRVGQSDRNYTEMMTFWP